MRSGSVPRTARTSVDCRLSLHPTRIFEFRSIRVVLKQTSPATAYWSIQLAPLSLSRTSVRLPFKIASSSHRHQQPQVRRVRSFRERSQLPPQPTPRLRLHRCRSPRLGHFVPSLTRKLTRVVSLPYPQTRCLSVSRGRMATSTRYHPRPTMVTSTLTPPSRARSTPASSPTVRYQALSSPRAV